MTLALFTVGGTGQAGPTDPNQFPVQVARRLAPSGWQIVADKLDGLATIPPVTWVPIDYPAALYPMAPSVQKGRENLVAAIRAAPGPFVLCGYSQGAIVTDVVWSQDILADDGVLHGRLPDVAAIVNFGDPLRCPGIANGNLLAGIPLPTELDGVVTGGIAGPADLTPDQTPDFLYSFALDGDLYACAPVGKNPWTAEAPAGRVETSIYDIVQQATVLDVAAIAEDLAMPVGTVEAIINGLTFLGAGANAPHYRYGPYVAVAAGKIRQLAARPGRPEPAGTKT
jgi:hypothetical protein